VAEHIISDEYIEEEPEEAPAVLSDSNPDKTISVDSIAKKEEV